MPKLKVREGVIHKIEKCPVCNYFVFETDIVMRDDGSSMCFFCEQKIKKEKIGIFFDNLSYAQSIAEKLISQLGLSVKSINCFGNEKFDCYMISSSDEVSTRGTSLRYALVQDSVNSEYISKIIVPSLSRGSLYYFTELESFIESVKENT